MAYRARRGSKGLQQAIDNFTKGLQMGWTHLDRQADRQAKLQNAQFAREKWGQEADLKRQELGINSRKADAYAGLAAAQAGYYGRKGAGGGAGAGSGEVDAKTYDWLNANSSGTISMDQPAPQREVVVPEAPPPILPEPMATGGKVRQKFAAGGRANAMANSMKLFEMGRRFGAPVQRPQAGTPPFNPNAPAPTAEGSRSFSDRMVAGPTYATVPPVAAVSSGGVTGPGSGYGQQAPPPGALDLGVPTYQRGGRVQKFQAGGSASPGLTNLLGTMANALGVSRPTVPPVRTPQEGRIVYDEQGKPIWMTPTGGGEPYNPQHGGATYGGATYGGATYGGAKPGGATPGGAKPGGNTYGGATPGGWRHRYPVHDTPTRDPGETGGTPDVAPRAPPQEPEFNFIMPAESNETGGTPGPQTAPAPRRGGGGGGYQARGGGLGDQRRTTAYDPVADRMDPRNIGVVYENGQVPAGVQGNVNPMVYAATQHGGIELNAPGQQIYKRGGRVQKFDEGGRALKFDSDNPRADIDVGKGRLTLGGNYDPNSRYGSLEGGYEHPVGRRGSVGVQGNIGKDIGPEGASAKPDWGVGVRGRVRFQDGGAARMPVPYQRGATPMPGVVGGLSGGVPAGQEPPDPGQAEADALTARWREEAMAAAELNQRNNDQANQRGPAPAPAPAPGGQRYGGNTYGGNTYGGAQYGGGRYGASAGPGETGGQPDMSGAPPPRTYYGSEAAPPAAPIIPYNPNVPVPPTRPTAHDESQGSGQPTAYPEPTRPEAHDESKGTGQKITGPGAAQPARPGVSAPRAAPDTSGQDEADRLTREWNAKNQAGAPPTNGSGVGPITKKGAVDITPPMQQGTGEPEGGQGLRGPGPGISTNNAARDHLGAATTFADWALKDAGPQKKEEATAALYSGKGAGTTEQIAAMMMAVDPENKMPLDKRFEAATKLAHDIHVAGGDVKAASQSSFEMVQYGVTKAREHGGQAVKLLQSGNEQGALKELMAGYTWIADNATVATKDGSIVVTGDDGKVRAQIPLQEGTVQNLAMGMMSGQLPWDAIRRGSNASGGAAQPGQPAAAVNTSYPAAGNAPAAGPPSSGPPSASSSAPAAQPSAAPAAQPSAAPAAPAPTPAAPAPQKTPPSTAISATPPAAQPAPAPSSAAPAPAPRPPASKPTPTQPAGGAQPKPASKAFPTIDLDKEAKDTQARIDAREGKSEVKTGKAEEKRQDKPAEKTETTSAKDDEAKLKKHHEEHPYDPPPGAVDRMKAPEQDAQIAELRASYARNRETYEKAVQKIDDDARARGISKKDFQRFRPKLMAELKAEFDKAQADLEKQRDRLITRQQAREDKEADKKPREITQSDEKEFKETFNTRATEIAEAKGDNADDTKDKVKYRDQTVLRYMTTPERRRELDHLAKEIWRDNRNLDKDKAMDVALGVTAIYKEGKGMNLQTGEKATGFRPLSRTLGGDYVYLMPDGSKVTVSPDTHVKVQRMHEQNWRQSNNEATKQRVKDEQDAKAGKDSFGRTVKALSYFNPFTIGPSIGMDIAKATRSEKK